MPTNLPRRQDKTFLVPFLWAFVLVPVVFGVAAYNFILYERAQLDAYRSHGGQVPIAMSGLHWNDH